MDILFSWDVYNSALRVFANFILVAIVVSFLIWVVALLVLPNGEDKRPASLAAVILTVGLLGAMTGYAGGNSRVGVVGDIIPAILTLLGGIVVYLFGVNSKSSPLAPFLVSALVISLFIGYGLGAKKRHLFETREGRKQVCIDVFSDPDILANESALRTATLLFGKSCKRVVKIECISGVLAPAAKNGCGM